MYSYYYFVCLLLYMFIHWNYIVFSFYKNDNIKLLRLEY